MSESMVTILGIETSLKSIVIFLLKMTILHLMDNKEICALI